MEKLDERTRFSLTVEIEKMISSDTVKSLTADTSREEAFLDWARIQKDFVRKVNNAEIMCNKNVVYIGGEDAITLVIGLSIWAGWTKKGKIGYCDFYDTDGITIDTLKEHKALIADIVNPFRMRKGVKLKFVQMDDGCSRAFWNISKDIIKEKDEFERDNPRGNLAEFAVAV